MKKYIIVAAALFFALAGCSELETMNSSDDNKTQDVFGDSMISAIKGHNASGKMSSKQSRANMEDIATFAQILESWEKGDLGFSLPELKDTQEEIDLSYRNLTQLTDTGKSNLAFQDKFFERLGYCKVLNISDRSDRAEYKIVDRIKYRDQPEKPTPLPNEVLELPTCDYVMVGGSRQGSKEIRKAINNKHDVRVIESEAVAKTGFTLSLKADAAQTNPVRMVKVETVEARGSKGIDKIGQTKTKNLAKWMVMTIELVNGQRFELTAIHRFQKSDTPVATNRNYNDWNLSEGFYAAFTTPNARLSFANEIRDASDMKERFERLTVNGEAIGETLD